MFSLYVAVGFWSTYTVDLLSVASTNGHFEPVCNSVSLPALPRSLLLHDFGNAPQLLVGLRDGTLVAFAFVKNEFQDKRNFSLGTEPVGLTQFEMGGKKVVFASGSRAGLFYLERGILQHSSILIKVNVTLCKTTPLNAALVNRAFLRARGSTHQTGGLLCFWRHRPDALLERCKISIRCTSEP
jgi:DNA damage-binding protein 1